MLCGIIGYFLARAVIPTNIKPHVLALVSNVQPLLIGAMLFVSFCKIRFSSIRFCKWHLHAVIFQMVATCLLTLIALVVDIDTNTRLLLESAIVCFLYPTATAAIVVVSKLGERTESLVTYVIFIHLATAIFAPIIASLLHNEGITCTTEALSFIAIKTLPLILIPLFAAAAFRKISPKVIDKLNKQKNLAFYLWAIALTFAMSFSMRSIVQSNISIYLLIGLAVISGAACAIQFYFGRRIGKHHHSSISASQALGQKNTVFGIWMAYTFFTPITAVVGGFYSVWHNMYNSWQLYQKCRKG